jgi:hypothetical protein
MDDHAPDREARLLAIAELTLEATALGEAALATDWTEARFRATRINTLAFHFGSQRVAQAAREVSRALGPEGQTPLPGYGAAVDALSQSIGKPPQARHPPLNTGLGISPKPGRSNPSFEPFAYEVGPAPGAI